MSHPVKNYCSQGNNSTCYATPSHCEKCAKQPLTAEQIINDFLFDEEVIEIKKTITTLFFEWVQSEVDYAQQERSAIAYHYQYLMDFFSKIETYQNKRREG